jgi:hypothetical protein
MGWVAYPPGDAKPLTDVQLMDGRTARVDVVSVMDRQSVELIPSHPIYDPLIQQIYDRLPDAIKSNQIKPNSL